jgi:Zn-dependent protease with chaperone function
VRVDVYLAMAAAVAASVLLPPAARRLAPRPAAVVLTVGSLLAAGVWTGGVALLAAALLGRVNLFGYVGHWSARAFAATVPVPPAVGVVGTGLLVVAALALALASQRLVAEMLRLYRLHREVSPARCGDVAVVDAPVPGAVALPGWHGSIVLTSSMLQALQPAEQRVLLAHERAHLRHRHWSYRLLVRLAAALLPSLRPVVGQCDQALERWADESAADAVGDRPLVARALARAAIAGAEAGWRRC